MQSTYKNPCEDCILYVKCSTHCKKLINLHDIVAQKVYDVCFKNSTYYTQYFDAAEINETLTEIVEEFIQPNTFKSVTISTDQVSVELNDGKIFNLIEHHNK
jgi:hypothetical protein